MARAVLSKHKKQRSDSTLPCWGQQKEYLPHLRHNRTREESREEKWQKSTEGIHESVGFCQTYTTHTPFISLVRGSRGNTVPNKHYSRGKRISLSAVLNCAQQPYSTKQTGIVGVHCVQSRAKLWPHSTNQQQNSVTSNSHCSTSTGCVVHVQHLHSRLVSLSVHGSKHIYVCYSIYKNPTLSHIDQSCRF